MASDYRTPGDQAFIEALGWCLWNFLYLEESIIRWLWLLRPEVSLSQWRSATAFGKGVELGREIKRRREDLPGDLRADLKAWLQRYEAAVIDARNAVAHGHAFTEEHGEDWWKPGLAYTSAKGEQRIVARSPGDLHEIAARIDAMTGELGDMEPRLHEAIGS